MEPESFQCSVCWSPPSAHVLQCNSGHIVCRECHDSLPQPLCPMCRVSMPDPPIRCVAIENALRTCELRCSGHTWGCKWIGTAAELKLHASGCAAAQGVKQTSSLSQKLSSVREELDTERTKSSSLETELQRVRCRASVTAVLEMRDAARADPSLMNTLKAALESTLGSANHVADAHTSVDPAWTCLARDLQELREHPLPCPFYAAPVCKADGQMDLFNWECSVPGLPGTLHDGAIYDFTISFASTAPGSKSFGFPLKPPVCKFVPGQRHMHENLYPSGKVCCGLLDQDKVWNPTISVAEVVLNLCVFMHRWNMADPALEYPYRLYKASRPIFRKLVRECAIAAQPTCLHPRTCMPLLLPLAIAAVQEHPKTRSNYYSEYFTRVKLGGISRRVFIAYHLSAGLTSVKDVSLNGDVPELICPSDYCAPIYNRPQGMWSQGEKPERSARLFHLQGVLKRFDSLTPALGEQDGQSIQTVVWHAYQSACEEWARLTPAARQEYHDAMMSARSDYLMEYLKSCKGFTTPPGRETTLPKVGDAIEVRLNVFADADAERWRPAVVRENYSHDGCFSTNVPVDVVVAGRADYTQLWWYYLEEQGTTWRFAPVVVAGSGAAAERRKRGRGEPAVWGGGKVKMHVALG